MTVEEISKKFSDQINIFLDRIKINHIVCHTPYFEGALWTEAQADAFLSASPFNKLPINHIVLLNNRKNVDILLQSHEDSALDDALVNCCQFLVNDVVEFCKKGENKYELNNLLRSNLIFLDGEINRMNYRAWWDESFANNNDNIFFVLFGNKKVWKSKRYVDITTSCMHFLDTQFIYRQNLIYRLKRSLIDIYSEYLLLPEIKTLPKFSYDLKKTELSEWIFGLVNSGKINESERLKALLLEIFQIDGQAYNNASHEIRARPKPKGWFLQKLADSIDGKKNTERKTENHKPTPETE